MNHNTFGSKCYIQLALNYSANAKKAFLKCIYYNFTFFEWSYSWNKLNNLSMLSYSTAFTYLGHFTDNPSFILSMVVLDWLIKHCYAASSPHVHLCILSFLDWNVNICHSVSLISSSTFLGEVLSIFEATTIHIQTQKIFFYKLFFVLLLKEKVRLSLWSNLYRHCFPT